MMEQQITRGKTLLISGIQFFTGTQEEAVGATEAGGLVLAPSGPGIACDLPVDPAYRKAVKGADLILPDSGAMVLAWNLLHAFSPKRRLRRLSGLKYLRAIVSSQKFREAKATLWVMPTKPDLDVNIAWLRDNGFIHLSRKDCYVAPMYEREADGTVRDEKLASIIEESRPKFVILNVGGGTQEQLGWYLRETLSYRPAIICTGAAIAFLSGRQANIPPWADQLYIGWLLRCLHAPKKFIPRYWAARHVFWTVLRYGDSMPPLRQPAKEGAR